MIRVAVVEEHQVLIDALEFVMRLEKEYEFVGGASTYSAGLSLVKATLPHVLLVDIHMPEGSGLEFVASVRAYSPTTRMIIFTGMVDKETVLRAVDLGVVGFVHKGCTLSELITTIGKASHGELVMPSTLLMSLLKRLPRSGSAAGSNLQVWENLTPRECQILSCLAAGKSSTEIAGDLNIAPLTVRTHVRNLMSKLGVHSRLEAVAFGLKHGLIDLSSDLAAG